MGRTSDPVVAGSGRRVVRVTWLTRVTRVTGLALVALVAQPGIAIAWLAVEIARLGVGITRSA
jgi:hypothetical protein